MELEVRDLRYTYNKKNDLLKGINMKMQSGKLYTILGASGCGKTTLLSILGGLDQASSGSVIFNGKTIQEIGEAKHRRDNVAFIFQNYNLIDYMTSYENVKLTAKLDPTPILLDLGLSKEEIRRNVLKLSGGQQQRVAVARAFASDKSLILADEPTGNLDEDTADSIFKLLKDNAHENNKCVVVVTHSSRLAAMSDYTFKLRKGKIENN